MWNKKSVVDNGGFWTDYLEEDKKLLIAQGYNEFEKKQGKPWALFDISKDNAWNLLGFFPSVEEAQKHIK